MQPSSSRIPLWRDVRFLRVFTQVVFLLLLIALFAFLTRNMLQSLKQQGMALGFSFLRLTSGFDIGETLIPYDRSSTYGRAFLVGLLNTANVSLLGIVFATLIGIVIGVARLSRNVLVQFLARAYIEALRNIPLLVLLIFIYAGVFLKMPVIKQALYLGPAMFTNRGVFIPWFIPSESYPTYRLILLFGLFAAVVVWVVLWRYGQKTGRPPLTWFWSLLTLIGVAAIGWFLLPRSPFLTEYPRLEGLRVVGGKHLTPEFMALWSGLVIYTSAFIADVVRAGIQAVSKGQTEAARALGLNGFQTLRFVVFPQALRVIVPPLTSHYLNLTKNSSLAVAVGYPDLFSVSGTILNQSGRAVEVIALAMSIYLSLSLLTSLFMNWYNRRIRFVER